MDSKPKLSLNFFHGSIFILCLMVTVTGCGIFNKNLEVGVEPEQYQAFFIALPEKSITPIENVLQKDKVVADFWIETQDPEIGTMGEKFEGVPHKGEPTRVALHQSTAYSDIKAVPADIEWKNFIAGKNIEEGLVFLVKASNGKVYKVKLKKFGKEVVKFTFKKLTS